jgi:hypothetical protein
MDETTRKGVRQFQDKYNAHFTGGLEIDGWVGVKTEAVMMEVSGGEPPGICLPPPPPKKRKPTDTPKPPDPTARLREVKKYVTSETLLCIINKILDRSHGDTSYFTAKSVNDFVGEPLGSADLFKHMFDLREDYEKMLARRRKATGSEPSRRDIQTWLEGKQSDIIDSVRALLYLDGYLAQTKEIRKFIHKLSQRAGSVYHCEHIKSQVDRVMDKVGPPYYSGNVG